MKVTIGIVLYNSEDTILLTLNSVAQQVYRDYQLIVWDNASEDGGGDIAKAHPAVDRFLKSPANLGFSGGHNQIIKRFPADYYFCLNPDVILEKDYLEIILSNIAGGHDIGSASGKLLRYNEQDSLVIDSVGHAMSYGIKAKNLFSGEEDIGQGQECRVRFGVSAAAALYNWRAIRSISLNGEFFDEKYFAYWEDLDVDWRLRCAGFKSIFIPTAKGYHPRGTILRPTKFTKYLGYRNRYLFVKKHRPQFLSPSHFLFYYLNEIYVFLEVIYKKNQRLALKAKFDVIKMKIGSSMLKPDGEFLHSPYFIYTKKEFKRLFIISFFILIISLLIFFI